MDRLIEIDRGRIANDGLPRCRSEQRSDAVAEPDGHVEPAGAVPASDQVVAPLLLDRAVQKTNSGARQRAQRISIEIDHALGKNEAVAKAAKWVDGIARDARLSRSHGGRRHHRGLSSVISEA